jgi:hypothetical protein
VQGKACEPAKRAIGERAQDCPEKRKAAVDLTGEEGEMIGDIEREAAAEASV